jgi:hypothetical protein
MIIHVRLYLFVNHMFFCILLYSYIFTCKLCLNLSCIVWSKLSVTFFALMNLFYVLTDYVALLESLQYKNKNWKETTDMLTQDW